MLEKPRSLGSTGDGSPAAARCGVGLLWLAAMYTDEFGCRIVAFSLREAAKFPS